MAENSSTDPLKHMQEDLQRALQHNPLQRNVNQAQDSHHAPSISPTPAVTWGMVIDRQKCIGCNACTVACITENALAPQVVFRPVLEEEHGAYPHPVRVYTPKPCMHCQNPPCVPVCPVQATAKDLATGVVYIDKNLCIGCKKCIKACPYGARVLDNGQQYSTHAPALSPCLVGQEGMRQGYGERGDFQKTRNIVQKCHFCLHRVHEGILPACVTSCIAKATFFGNLNDAEALVTKMYSAGAAPLLPEAHTAPRVFYLS